MRSLKILVVMSATENTLTIPTSSRYRLGAIATTKDPLLIPSSHAPSTANWGETSASSHLVTSLSRHNHRARLLKVQAKPLPSRQALPGIRHFDREVDRSELLSGSLSDRSSIFKLDQHHLGVLVDATTCGARHQ
jgi:hypothetical protein